MREEGDDDLGDGLDSELDADLDLADEAPGTGGPARRHATSRRRTALVVAGVVGAVALLAGGVALAALAGRSADGERTLLDGPLTASRLFPVLDQDAEPGTGFPASTLLRSLGVVPSSPRPVGSTSTADFWVARTDRGRVCLLARDIRDAEGLGGTCGSPAEAAQGLRLPAGEGVSAVLVPPEEAVGSASATALAQEGYVRASDVLWVDGESAARTVEALVDAASERTVVVPSEAREGTAALPVFLTEDDVPHAVVLTCLRGEALEVTVARGTPQRVDCGEDAAFVRFEGRGGPVRVDVTAPPGLVWAAAVVRCSGSLLGPVC